MARPHWRSLLALLAGLVVAGCYAPSAARRASRLVQDGWDADRRGAWVAVTGPALTVAAVGDFAVHALVPLDYDGYFLVDRREPKHKWFRTYLGPMLPLERVAVLCKTRRAIHIVSIRDAFDTEAREARHEPWHFPVCIEALPGLYELTVEYYARRHYDSNSHLSTYTTESTTPASVRWDARAGAVYQMDAVLGSISPGPDTQRPGSTIRRVPRSKRKLGTSRFYLDVGKWYVLVKAVESWDALEAPALQYRADWQRYEALR